MTDDALPVPAPADILRCIRGDIDVYIERSAAFSGQRRSALRVVSILLTPAILCVLLYRLAHWCWEHRMRRTAVVLTRLNYLVHKAWIAPDTRAGPGLYIPHTVGVMLEATAGERLTLYANCIVGAGHQPGGEREKPVLGDHVTVGAFSIVQGKLFVGSGTRVGPGSMLDVDTRPDSMTIAKAHRPGSPTRPRPPFAPARASEG